MLRLTIALFLLQAPIAGDQAPSGSVVLRACNNHFVVDSRSGYVLLQWFGGHEPVVGEQISGEFERYGMKDVLYTQDRRGRALVEDFWLSRTALLSRLGRLCPGLPLPELRGHP